MLLSRQFEDCNKISDASTSAVTPRCIIAKAHIYDVYSLTERYKDRETHHVSHTNGHIKDVNSLTERHKDREK
jgi:hypothetical protein